MILSQQKEQFSSAYLQAVTASAGYSLAKPTVDDDSIDWCILARASHSTPRRPRLELQLKCTARNIQRTESIHFPLERKNYDDLRSPDVFVPRILVVMIVPDQAVQWLRHSEEQTIIYHSGYWHSLRGAPAVHQETITVYLPRVQLFTPDALRQIMQRIDNGGLP